MARATQEQWAAARFEWETDPIKSYADIATKLGVTRQAVAKRASEEGWARAPELADLAKRAQLKADQRQVATVAGVVVGSVDLTTEKATLASREAAEDIRADVIERHRADWAEHRTHFTLGAIVEDFEMGKKAKISAEMLKIRQQGEREAYGLDAVQQQAAPTAPDWTALVRAPRPDA